MRSFDYVVIGAGPAGGAAALELAAARHKPSVALIGAEAHAPYERPPLSKSVLRNTALQDAPQSLFGGKEAIELAGVELLLGQAVTHLEIGARVITLDSGERLSYGSLLFATGASARRLRVPGASLKGVHVLRTFEDAAKLAIAMQAPRVVVVGGGFIGLEVAATAAQAGCSVTVIEAASRLLARAVPEVVSAAVLQKFESQGVNVILRRGVMAIHGDVHVHSLELTDGVRIDADVVVVGVGASPNDELAREAGLLVNDGIVVDSDGRTSDPHCFAAGDVARRPAGLAWNPQYRCRLEAWEPALQQGQAVASVMRGEVAKPLDPPWVWSDMFDWNIQMLGHGELADFSLVRVGCDSSTFTALQLSNGRLVGAVTVNDGRHMASLKRGIASGLTPDIVQLADSSIPLRIALQTSPISRTVKSILE